MILIRTPVRISLVGGGSDLDEYIKQHGMGSVISFTPDIYTYVIVQADRIGKNSLDNKYVISYSRREEVEDINKIDNELIKEFLVDYSIPPVGVILTSDIFSQGSGLAVSSSYSAGLSLAFSEMLGNTLSQIDVGENAHRIEKKINYKLGQQDVFGCCIGGFKRIDFQLNGLPRYTFLPCDLFNHYSAYLIYTGITRNSTEILSTYTIPSNNRLVELVNIAETCIIESRYDDFFSILKDGWAEKKVFSPRILEDELLKSMDDELTMNPKCRAHKLCGAGGGGFFLAFFDKEYIPKPNFKKINLSTLGVEKVV